MNNKEVEMTSMINHLNSLPDIAVGVSHIPSSGVDYLVARVRGKAYSVCYYPPPHSGTWTIFEGDIPNRAKVLANYDQCDGTRVKCFFSMESNPPKWSHVTSTCRVSFAKSKGHAGARCLSIYNGDRLVGTVPCRCIKVEHDFNIVAYSETEFKVQRDYSKELRAKETA